MSTERIPMAQFIDLDFPQWYNKALPDHLAEQFPNGLELPEYIDEFEGQELPNFEQHLTDSLVAAHEPRNDYHGWTHGARYTENAASGYDALGGRCGLRIPAGFLHPALIGSARHDEGHAGATFFSDADPERFVRIHAARIDQLRVNLDLLKMHQKRREADGQDTVPAEVVATMLVDEAGLTQEQAARCLELAEIRSSDTSFVKRVRALSDSRGAKRGTRLIQGVFVTLFVLVIVEHRIVPPRPAHWGPMQRILSYVQWIGLPFVGIFDSCRRRERGAVLHRCGRLGVRLIGDSGRARRRRAPRWRFAA